MSYETPIRFTFPGLGSASEGATFARLSLGRRDCGEERFVDVSVEDVVDEGDAPNVWLEDAEGVSEERAFAIADRLACLGESREWTLNGNWSAEMALDAVRGLKAAKGYRMTILRQAARAVSKAGEPRGAYEARCVAASYLK